MNVDFGEEKDIIRAGEPLENNGKNIIDIEKLGFIYEKLSDSVRYRFMITDQERSKYRCEVILFRDNHFINILPIVQ
jgi:hypothetical protein